MSRVIGKHLKEIKQQRKILDEYRQYEKQIDEFQHQAKLRELASHATVFETWSYQEPPMAIHQISQYEDNLNLAEYRLKAAAAKGSVVEITGTRLAQDLQSIKAPSRASDPTGNKLRVRRNLARLDFFERFDHLPEVETYKLTIPTLKPIDLTTDTIGDIALYLNVAIYQPIVLLSFKDPADALLYTIAVQ